MGQRVFSFLFTILSAMRNVRFYLTDDYLFAGHLQSWADLLTLTLKTLDFIDLFFNLPATFTVAVKRPKTAKPDGFSGFNPSDFSLSTAGRLIIDVTHYRLFLSALTHYRHSSKTRDIPLCNSCRFCNGFDAGRCGRGPCRLYLTESGPGAGCVGCG